MRLIRQLALALLLAAPLAASADSKPLPAIESFFENAAFGGAQLSPSGRHLAALVGGNGHRDFLVVIDLQTNDMKRVAAYSDADVGAFQWVNDERLLYSMTDKQVAPGELHYAPGLYAVNRDGSATLQLAARRGGANLVRKVLPWHTYMLNQRGAQDSDSIYVISAEGDNGLRLLQLNTVTGRSQQVGRPAPAKGWMLDDKGEPRLMTSTEQQTTRLHYRDPASGEWRVLASFDTYKRIGGVSPVGFGPDGTLYVSTRMQGDTAALYRYDLAAAKVVPEPVLVTTGYDFSGRLVTAGGKLLGVRFATDTRSTAWLDPAMKALQDKVDAALPATVNLISVPPRAQTPWVLVESFSDVVPPSFALYNAETGLVNPVANSRPRIDPARMGRQQVVRYKARDGMEIP
ncbi:MAG TPA: S9 family peptidase, partial [Telluria sp.]|nr:S9 family peptidase [Telluria sp.]